MPTPIRLSVEIDCSKGILDDAMGIDPLSTRQELSAIIQKQILDGLLTMPDGENAVELFNKRGASVGKARLEIGPFEPMLAKDPFIRTADFWLTSPK